MAATYMSSYLGGDFYKVLGLKREENPSQAEIDKAFRKLSRETHPDMVLSGITITDPQIQNAYGTKFKDLQYAHSILSDEDKRRDYDMLNGYTIVERQRAANKRTVKEEEEEFRKASEKLKKIKKETDEAKRLIELAIKAEKEARGHPEGENRNKLREQARNLREQADVAYGNARNIDQGFAAESRREEERRQSTGEGHRGTTGTEAGSSDTGDGGGTGGAGGAGGTGQGGRPGPEGGSGGAGGDPGPGGPGGPDGGPSGFGTGHFGGTGGTRFGGRSSTGGRTWTDTEEDYIPPENEGPGFFNRTGQWFRDRGRWAGEKTKAGFRRAHEWGREGYNRAEDFVDEIRINNRNRINTRNERELRVSREREGQRRGAAESNARDEGTHAGGGETKG
jgi:curved DNA-binding protein CbpA